MLTAMLEHENAIRIVFPKVLIEELSLYLQECLVQVDQVKAWAGSTEVYMLRSGKASMIRTPGLSHPSFFSLLSSSPLANPFNLQPPPPGMLPEEDFAIVEERTRTNERLAESLMSRLFDVTRDEQQRLVDTLKWVRARMDHDYREYLTGMRLSAALTSPAKRWCDLIYLFSRSPGSGDGLICCQAGEVHRVY